MTDKERIIFENGFEEGYTVARRNYEGLPIGYSKWLSHGEKYQYLKHYNKTLMEAFKKEFGPEIEDHLTCGNEQCFYDGQWCYHLTDKEFDKMINFLEEYESTKNPN